MLWGASNIQLAPSTGSVLLPTRTRLRLNPPPDRNIQECSFASTAQKGGALSFRAVLITLSEYCRPQYTDRVGFPRLSCVKLIARNSL